MPRKKAAKYKCEKCGKEFAMAMHLGRHMTTIHGQAAKAAKAAKAVRPQRTAAAGTRSGRRIGRPAGFIRRMGLKDMSLEQLIEVIAAAKEEAGQRIAAFQEAINPSGRLHSGRPYGRTRVVPTKPAAGSRPRARRKFAMSGAESIVAFVSKAGSKGATTAEIVKNWKSQGRGGDGYTTIGELVKARKLKKESLEGQRGSRYVAA
jgi:ribosomal protein S14